MSQKRRVAVVVSHPIQYFTPFWRALAEADGLDLHVLFASRIGLDRTYDVDMRAEIAWATDLTNGYSHEFLPEAAALKNARQLDNPSVGAALARFRPHAVIIHGYATKTMLRALLWCKLHRTRALMTADSSVHVSPPGLRRSIKHVVAPPLLRCFDAALTMGDRSEQHLASLRYPRARMFRTPVMIDAAFWRARDQRAALRARARERLQLNGDDFTLLCVCKLTAQKRVANILVALSELARDKNARRTSLLIAGDGEERAALQEMAHALGVDARLLGFTNIDALPELYAAADALVHAGEREQYGMIALEAAVIGLPLVLSNETGAIGPTSIARADVNALVFPCGDIAALTLAMRRMRDDEDLRTRMSEASLAISRDHEGPQSVAAVQAATG
jgi:glycosyltransferase involved in cell wall biosynthesis